MDDHDGGHVTGFGCLFGGRSVDAGPVPAEPSGPVLPRFLPSQDRSRPAGIAGQRGRDVPQESATGTTGRPAQPRLPTGTLTFLFTDIEGSTRLLQEAGDDYARLLADHRRLLGQGRALTLAQGVDRALMLGPSRARRRRKQIRAT